MSGAALIARPEPELQADFSERLYEVADGLVTEKPMGAFEIEVASILFIALAAFVREANLGKAQTEMMFLIDPARNLKRRPDVSFVSRERWPIAKPAPRTEAWNVVPDLAVEVVSPTNTAGELVQKVDDYFGAGVRLVWLVYPSHGLVQVYESASTMTVLRREDDLEGGDVVPGFRLPLASLLPDGTETD